MNENQRQINISDISLIVVNLVVIAYAYFGNHDLAWVFWVYWYQSIIIGLFNTLKIFTAKDVSIEGIKINDQIPESKKGTQTVLGVFFIMHYGFFHLIYFIFLAIEVGLGQLFTFDMAFAVILFFLNHLLSFVVHNGRESVIHKNLAQLFITPYLRIVPMHLIIVFGGLFSQSLGAVILMCIKTVIDLLSHLNEHWYMRNGKVELNFNTQILAKKYDTKISLDLDSLKHDKSPSAREKLKKISGK